MLVQVATVAEDVLINKEHEGGINKGRFLCDQGQHSIALMQIPSQLCHDEPKTSHLLLE